jgi:hypothetical protein
MFAKLFTTEDRGQLLVVRQTNADGEPEMRAYCEPEGLGVCSVALSWDDDENGWDLQEACFERCTEESARKMTDGVFQQAAEMFGQNDQRQETASK